jgi:hypothetical protein
MTSGTRGNAGRELLVDERRRTSLAKFGRKEHDRYLVEEYPDGSLLLTPAVTISVTELAVLQDPELMRQVQDGLDRPKDQLRRRTRPPGV